MKPPMAPATRNPKTQFPGSTFGQRNPAWSVKGNFSHSARHSCLDPEPDKFAVPSAAQYWNSADVYLKLNQRGVKGGTMPRAPRKTGTIEGEVNEHFDVQKEDFGDYSFANLSKKSLHGGESRDVVDATSKFQHKQATGC